MNKKIGTTFLCIAFSYHALIAQSTVEDQVQRLQSEIENLKSINQELRKEFDFLPLLVLSPTNHSSR